MADKEAEVAQTTAPRSGSVELQTTDDVNRIEAPVTWKAYLICAFAAFGGIFFGYDSGYINGVLGSAIFIREVEGPDRDPDDGVTSSHQSLIVSILSCGTFFGAIISGDVADIIGRKWTVIMGCVIYLLGVVIQMITGPEVGSSLGAIVAGRLIAGVGVGFESAVVILYMSEICPRKVKCDESGPICGPCYTRGRPCTWLYATRRSRIAFVNTSVSQETSDLVTDLSETNEFVHTKNTVDFATSLALRTTPNKDFTVDPSFAMQGKGRGKRRNDALAKEQLQKQHYTPAPWQHPTCTTTTIVLRWRSWCEMICPGEPQAYLIGEYLEGVPHYIGKLQSIDMALQCAMDSTLAVTNRSDYNYVNACRFHVKTISALREDVVRLDNTPSTWAMILLATTLVYFSEAALHTYKISGRIRKIGATNLLLAASKNGTECDEYLLQMFSSLTSTEFLPSIITDMPSPFDTPIWLSQPIPPLPNPQYPRADEVELYNKHRHIRIPGLVHLIRQLRNDHTNISLRHQVYALADELYNTTLQDWIDELFDLHLIQWSFGDQTSSSQHFPQPAAAGAPSVEDSLPSMPSLQFSTSRLFVRFLAYQEMRCVLAGCIQTICSIPEPPYASPTAITFDLAAAQAEDIRAASMIAACDNYAVSDSSPLKMRQAIIAWPALFSYGSWRRLELRAAEVVASTVDPTLATSSFDYPAFDYDDDDNFLQNSVLGELNAVSDAFDAVGAEHELRHARAMKAWVLNKLHWLKKTWAARVWTEADLNWLLDVAAGADLVPNQQPLAQQPGEVESTIRETVNMLSSRLEGL